MSPIEIISRPLTVEYGHERIPYDLSFSDRKTIEVGVLPDGSVEVRAPEGRTRGEVHARVQKQARWIVKQRRYFESIGPPPQKKEYVSGETHHYLGRQYRLRVVPNSAARAGRARLIGPYLEVELADPTPERVRQLVFDWYRRRAEDRLPERYQVGADLVRKYGIEAPAFGIRRMKTRWGSFTPSGRILLNPELMTVPVYCIDYVIVHELCHVRHPDHGSSFYKLLSRALPDWRRSKSRLDRAGR